MLYFCYCRLERGMLKCDACHCRFTVWTRCVACCHSWTRTFRTSSTGSGFHCSCMQGMDTADPRTTVTGGISETVNEMKTMWKCNDKIQVVHNLRWRCVLMTPFKNMTTKRHGLAYPRVLKNSDQYREVYCNLFIMKTITVQNSAKRSNSE